MKTKYIDVDGYWGIVIVYDFDVRKDWYELEATMDSFGMDERKIQKSMKILSQKNTGMAISRDDLRMSAIYLADTTSTDEFWSTAIHECKHVADAIIDYYGVVWDSEDAAYLTGYLTKEMVLLLGEPCY